MADLATRPRGGWQFGNRPRGSSGPIFDGTTRLLPNGQPDPAPDCYLVVRVEPGVFHVKHYVDADAREARCEFDARRVVDDVAEAAREGIDVDIVTLRRAAHDCVILGARE